MALTINGSGGGLTAPEVEALTGWNVLHSISVSKAGSFTASSQSKTETLYTYSSSDFSLDGVNEIRLRFEPTTISGNVGPRDEYASVRIGFGPGATSATYPYVAFSTKFLYPSQVTYLSRSTRPIISAGVSVASYDTPYDTWEYYANSSTSISRGHDTSIFKIYLYINKRANSTKLNNYTVEGTLYIEGRY